MTDHCIVDARDDAVAARDALLAHPAIAAVSLSAPRADPYDAWTLEASVLTSDATHPAIDGWEPHHARTAAEHGLSVRRVAARSPHETTVLLTV